MTRDDIRSKYKDDPNWPIQSFDAMDWAKAFVDTFGQKPEVVSDEGLFLTWFANALMRGYDEGCRAAEAASPAGWRLVPVEPTVEMIAAGHVMTSNPVNIWSSLLAAAPLPKAEG